LHIDTEATFTPQQASRTGTSHADEPRPRRRFTPAAIDTDTSRFRREASPLARRDTARFAMKKGTRDKRVNDTAAHAPIAPRVKDTAYVSGNK